jgi:nucleosome binding factor SPN SPT16 subunit
LPREQTFTESTANYQWNAILKEVIRTDEFYLSHDPDTGERKPVGWAFLTDAGWKEAGGGGDEEESESEEESAYEGESSEEDEDDDDDDSEFEDLVDDDDALVRGGLWLPMSNCGLVLVVMRGGDLG